MQNNDEIYQKLSCIAYYLTVHRVQHKMKTETKFNRETERGMYINMYIIITLALSPLYYLRYEKLADLIT